jgi:hypothetical protein
MGKKLKDTIDGVLGARLTRLADGSCGAWFLAEALALEAVELAVARGEALRVADVRAVAVTPARSTEPVALRLAVPVPVSRLRHPRRPHLCKSQTNHVVFTRFTHI